MYVPSTLKASLSIGGLLILFLRLKIYAAPILKEFIRIDGLLNLY